jgi:MFS family permease
MSYIDRTNVGNAKLFGALTDMNLTGQQWNTALAVFFVTYSFGAVPANIALQRLGPRIWLPTMMLSVSIILICASMQSNFGGWTAFRFLLGFVEAGIFPGCSAVLTTWYSPHEIHSRMTIFYTGASAAGGFSGLLAYAIGQLDGTWGYRGWRWIYCLEGKASGHYVTLISKLNPVFRHLLRRFIDLRVLDYSRHAGEGCVAHCRRETILDASPQVLSWWRDRGC